MSVPRALLLTDMMDFRLRMIYTDLRVSGIGFYRRDDSWSRPFFFLPPPNRTAISIIVVVFGGVNGDFDVTSIPNRQKPMLWKFIKVKQAISYNYVAWPWDLDKRRFEILLFSKLWHQIMLMIYIFARAVLYSSLLGVLVYSHCLENWKFLVN